MTPKSSSLFGAHCTCVVAWLTLFIGSINPSFASKESLETECNDQLASHKYLIELTTKTEEPARFLYPQLEALLSNNSNLGKVFDDRFAHALAPRYDLGTPSSDQESDVRRRLSVDLLLSLGELQTVLKIVELSDPQNAKLKHILEVLPRVIDLTEKARDQFDQASFGYYGNHASGLEHATLAKETFASICDDLSSEDFLFGVQSVIAAEKLAFESARAKEKDLREKIIGVSRELVLSTPETRKKLAQVLPLKLSRFTLPLLPTEADRKSGAFEAFLVETESSARPPHFILLRNGRRASYPEGLEVGQYVELTTSEKVGFRGKGYSGRVLSFGVKTNSDRHGQVHYSYAITILTDEGALATAKSGATDSWLKVSVVRKGIFSPFLNYQDRRVQATRFERVGNHWQASSTIEGIVTNKGDLQVDLKLDATEEPLQIPIVNDKNNWLRLTILPSHIE